MSLKNFYQAFYENEQLFRLENDPFSVPTATSARLPDALLVDAEPGTTDLLVGTSITALAEGLVTAEVTERAAEALVIDPVAAPTPSAEPEVERPVALEAAPIKTAPSIYPPLVADPPAINRPLLSHKVLILVDEELLPSDLLFLEKILNAINLNIDGVDLLNVHGLNGVDFTPILADKVIHHFLTFGVSFQRLNLDILMDRYQPVRFHGITFMIADPLAAIEGDKNLKKRLWEALKRIFLMG